MAAGMRMANGEFERDPPFIQHDDPIGQMHGFADTLCDEAGGEAEFAPDAVQ